MPIKTKNTSSILLFSLLGSRLVLFIFFQAIIALIASSWQISEKYWLLAATLTNIVGIVFLVFLFRADGKSYFSLFKINKSDIKKDILIFAGITSLTVPIVFASNYFLSLLLWDNINIPTKMMFGTIEKRLVYILLFVFPITIAFAELATYFGYIMPKLQQQLKNKWLAVFLPVLFLSIQHCTLPFIPDINFIIYRALVFLPFAAIIGVSIHYRPSLFTYFAILHGIMDFGAVLMFLKEI
jgi:hypothetical protein